MRAHKTRGNTDVRNETQQVRSHSHHQMEMARVEESQDANADTRRMMMMIRMNLVYKCLSTLKPLPNKTKQAFDQSGVSRLDTPTSLSCMAQSRRIGAARGPTKGARPVSLKGVA